MGLMACIFDLLSMGRVFSFLVQWTSGLTHFSIALMVISHFLLDLSSEALNLQSCLTRSAVVIRWTGAQIVIWTGVTDAIL